MSMTVMTEFVWSLIFYVFRSGRASELQRVVLTLISARDDSFTSSDLYDTMYDMGSWFLVCSFCIFTICTYIFSHLFSCETNENICVEHP